MDAFRFVAQVSRRISTAHVWGISAMMGAGSVRNFAPRVMSCDAYTYGAKSRERLL
jgi:hypothetical protein